MSLSFDSERLAGNFIITYFLCAIFLSGLDRSFGWSWWHLPPVWRGTWGDCHVCDCCLFPVRSRGHGAPSEGGMISSPSAVFQVLVLFFLWNWWTMFSPNRTRSSSWWTLSSARNPGTLWLRPSVWRVPPLLSPATASMCRSLLVLRARPQCPTASQPCRCRYCYSIQLESSAWFLITW